MNCPYCNFKFSVLIANTMQMQPLTPVICEHCGDISLLENGTLRTMSPEEQTALKQSPAYKSFLEPAKLIVDRFRMAQKARWN